MFINVKRIERAISYLVLAALLCLFAVPIHVFASEPGTVAGAEGGATSATTSDSGNNVYTDASLDTGDAISDILQGSRYKGAISSIGWFTERVDSITVMLVSASAFFIISAAFLKNVCAGVYCANSKFFDKVDDAHKKAEALSIASVKGYITGGQFQNTSYGALRDSLLALIPNFKSFTEFEEADIEPKQYFMKSIPQMIFCVMIGIFIYNGYYRDTAVKVGQFGSEAFVRVMAAASPVELLDRISATTGRPDFATDDLMDPAGKFANSIAKDIYSAVITRYTGLTTEFQKETFTALMEKDVVAAVDPWISEYFQNAEGNTWKASYKISLSSSDISKKSIKTDNSASYFEKFGPINESWRLGELIEEARTETVYCYLTVVFTRADYTGKDANGQAITSTKDAPSGGSGSSNTWGSAVDVTLQFDFSNGISGVCSSIPQGMVFTTKSGSADLSAGNASAKVTLNYPSANTPVLTVNLPSANSAPEGGIPCNRNVYVIDSDGVKHPIVIRVGSSTN